MTLVATRAQRIEKTAALVAQIKAIEDDVYDILHEGETGCEDDNGCDLFDLENEFLYAASLFQLKISAYRAERLCIEARIARDRTRKYVDRDDEHRTHGGRI